MYGQGGYGQGGGYGGGGGYGQSRGGPRRMGGPSFAPVKVGDELDVTIEAVGEKGDGVAKVKGFVLFVPNVKEGDQVKVRVNKVLRKVGFAEVIGAGEAKEETQEEEAPAETESFGEEKTEEAAPEPEKETEEVEEEPEEEPEVDEETQ